MSGQHRDLPFREIDRGAAPHRLLEQGVSRTDVVGDVGDMDADQIIAVLFLNGQGVVEIKGRGAIDGQRRQVGEIDPAGIVEQLPGIALQDRLRLLAGGEREADRDVVTQQRQVFVPAPDPGIDEEMERVVGAGKLGLLEDASGQFGLIRLVAEQIILADDAEAFLEPGIELVPACRASMSSAMALAPFRISSASWRSFSNCWRICCTCSEVCVLITPSRYLNRSGRLRCSGERPPPCRRWPFRRGRVQRGRPDRTRRPPPRRPAPRALPG